MERVFPGKPVTMRCMGSGKTKLQLRVALKGIHAKKCVSTVRYSTVSGVRMALNLFSCVILCRQSMLHDAPVGDRNNGTVFKFLSHCFLDQGICLYIHICSGLIQNQDLQQKHTH